MAIFSPGKSYRYHNILKRKNRRRGLTVILSLTAMVDMFTVLVIFLLQNYNVTGEVIHLPKNIVLPKANRVIELKPALIVTISENDITVDNKKVMSLKDAQEFNGLVLNKLRDETKVLLEKIKKDHESEVKLGSEVNVKVNSEDNNPEAWRKVTVQADQAIDYATIKKVLYSINQAGGGPINFAVAKDANR